MAWFKKEKKKGGEDDDDLEEDEEESPKKPLRRKLRNKDFKDLNPGDKKKRKEPPKPWGKKERYTILSLLFLTAGVSGFLALSARDYKLPGLPRITKPSIKMPNFLTGETIVIEGNVGKKHQTTISEFEEKIRSLTGVYGLYVVRLNDGLSYGVNENEVFTAASLIKLPVMVGLYMEKEAGRLNLNTKYSLKNGDKIGGSGSLRTKPPGYEITYKNIIKLMAKESDNTAFNIARNYLGDTKITEIINKIGMNHTNIENNETTPEDIGLFFKQLWNNELINRENKDELLDFMTDTIYEDWLPKGIPEGVRVSHKYGRETHVINDAGIIHADSPYVVVILSKSISEREGDAAFPELSKIVYDFETMSKFESGEDSDSNYQY